MSLLEWAVAVALTPAWWACTLGFVTLTHAHIAWQEMTRP